MAIKHYGLTIEEREEIKKKNRAPNLKREKITNRPSDLIYGAQLCTFDTSPEKKRGTSVFKKESPVVTCYPPEISKGYAVFSDGSKYIILPSGQYLFVEKLKKGSK